MYLCKKDKTMLTYLELSELINRTVAGLTLSEEPKLLFDPIRYTLAAGGKRVRPLLALGSCSLFTDAVQPALPAAMGIEVFHNFTLLHDDIMDKSVMRRGRDTVHIKWNENVAILSGDAMLIYAYDLLSQSDETKVSRLFPVFNRMVMGVCEGQMYDMEFETRSDVRVEEYLQMIERKTAVLFAGAAQIGAIMGGADQATAQKLYDFGINLGMAFQLQDDWLDTYGDPKTFGKNIGGDIMSNKKTFLLIKALELSQGELKEALTHWISGTVFDREEKFEAVKAIYQKTGVKRLAEELLEDYFVRATEMLDGLDLPEERKGLLREITRILVKRDK